jgi:hypothetical protein
MLKSFLVGCLVCVSSNAFAQQYCRAYPIGTVLSAVALNGAASTRTFTVGPTVGGDNLLQYKAIALDVDFTEVNAGAITITCKQGQTVLTATHSMGVCKIQTNGSCLLSMGGVVYTDTLSTSTNYSFVIGTNGAAAISCVVSHGGSPGATDLITIKGNLIGSGC